MKRASGLLYSMVLSLFVCLLPSAVFAKPYSELIIISGSLSDVGNYASVHGWFGPPFWNNRSTNGRNLDDYFSEMLDFPNDPSLHLIGPARGNNFAVFQSLAAGHGPEDLPAQIQAYLTSRGGKADPEALHLLLIGGTDVINALLEPNDRTSSKMLDAAVAGMENALRTLVKNGARTIYAPNFTDLGKTPYAVKNGVTKRATRICQEYNRKYDAMLDRVERQLDFELIRWDFFAYTQELFKHIDELGFTNWTDACLDLEPSGQCDLSRFVFLADFFPTTRVHQYFATAMMQAYIERDKNRCTRFGGRFEQASHKCHGWPYGFSGQSEQELVSP
jgi:phospholipase/lecithinase/hemolysin